MAKQMIPLGAVVIGACDLRIEGICEYPSGNAGAVFVFNDNSGKQWNVCKKCSDYQYGLGEWRRDLQSGSKAEKSSSELKAFITEFNAAKTNDKNLVLLRYHDTIWTISVPISAGIYEKGFWVTDINIGGIGWVKIAFQDGDEATPALVKVQPVCDMKEYFDKNQALLVVKERIK